MQDLSNADLNAWRSGPVSLRYVIGDFLLFTAGFEGRILESRFQDLVHAVAVPRPPIENLTSGLNTLLMRSFPTTACPHPIAVLQRAIRYTPFCYRRFLVDLNGTFENYLQHFSSKSRSTLLRKIRRFKERSEGTIDWKVYTTVDDVADFLTCALEVSRNTYQERLLGLGLPSDSLFRERMYKLAAADRFRGFILFLRKRPIAFLSCPAVEDTLLYQHLGYNPEFQEYSPGTVLQFLAFQWLFSENLFSWFDFTEGEGPQKEFFSTHHVTCADIYFFRRTLRNLFVVGTHYGWNFFGSLIGKTLRWLGWKASFKKALRSLGLKSHGSSRI